jgi:RNA polymerase sigma factor (sigma-70 family)
MVFPEQTLITGFLAGEREALHTIDEWIARAAFPYRQRLDLVWEDVLQAARLEITRLLQAGKFRGEASLKTYLWRVINNVCLTFIRKQTRCETVEIAAILEKPDTAAHSPLETVLQKESGSIALRVWTQMSGDCRELWQMILRGMSYEAMSQEKGVAAGTLRVRVLRCREKAVMARNFLLQARV